MYICAGMVTSKARVLVLFWSQLNMALSHLSFLVFYQEQFASIN